jgi:hypothetical protein
MHPMAATATACNFCGRRLAPHEVNYTANAAIACPTCNARAEAVTLEARANDSATNASINVVLMCVWAVASALLAFVWNPYFVVSLLSAGSALYLLSAAGQGQLRAFRSAMLACAIVSLALNVAIGALTLLAIGVIASGAMG